MERHYKPTGHSPRKTMAQKRENGRQMGFNRIFEMAAIQPNPIEFLKRYDHEGVLVAEYQRAMKRFE